MQTEYLCVRRAQAQRDAAAAGQQPPGAVERLLEASGKLELLDKMLLRLVPSGHRVLIYSQFTTVSLNCFAYRA